MTVTRIGEANIQFFKGFLMEAGELQQNNILDLGVIDDGVACGAAVFSVGRYTAELLSLFVAPGYRRRGAAREMLSTFSALAAGTEVRSLTAAYIRGSTSELDDFFAACGFERFDSSPQFSVRIGDMQGSAQLRKYLAAGADHTIPFRELLPYQKKELEILLQKYDVSLREITSGIFSPALSFAAYDAKGKCSACAFCSDRGESVGVDFLLSNSAAASPTLAVLRALFEALEKRGQPEQRLEFLAANPAVIPIAQKLLGPLLRHERGAVYAVRLFDPAGAPESDAR